MALGLHVATHDAEWSDRRITFTEETGDDGVEGFFDFLTKLTGSYWSSLCENTFDTFNAEIFVWIACEVGSRKFKLVHAANIGAHMAVGVASAVPTALPTIKRPRSRPDRFKQSCDDEDTHHSLEVVGLHMKAHLNAYPR